VEQDPVTDHLVDLAGECSAGGDGAAGDAVGNPVREPVGCEEEAGRDRVVARAANGVEGHVAQPGRGVEPEDL